MWLLFCSLYVSRFWDTCLMFLRCGLSCRSTLDIVFTELYTVAPLLFGVAMQLERRTTPEPRCRSFVYQCFYFIRCFTLHFPLHQQVLQTKEQLCALDIISPIYQQIQVHRLSSYTVLLTLSILKQDAKLALLQHVTLTLFQLMKMKNTCSLIVSMCISFLVLHLINYFPRHFFSTSVFQIDGLNLLC